jgi:hypothetical protein
MADGIWCHALRPIDTTITTKMDIFSPTIQQNTSTSSAWLRHDTNSTVGVHRTSHGTISTTHEQLSTHSEQQLSTRSEQPIRIVGSARTKMRLLQPHTS